MAGSATWVGAAPNVGAALAGLGGLPAGGGKDGRLVCGGPETAFATLAGSGGVTSNGNGGVSSGGRATNVGGICGLISGTDGCLARGGGGGAPKSSPDGCFARGAPRSSPDGCLARAAPKSSPDGCLARGAPKSSPDGC